MSTGVTIHDHLITGDWGLEGTGGGVRLGVSITQIMTDSFNAAEYHRQLDLDEEEKKARIEERLQHIKLSNRGLTFVPQFVLQVKNIR
jgi:hypothetical protein